MGFGNAPVKAGAALNMRQRGLVLHYAMLDHTPALEVDVVVLVTIQQAGGFLARGYSDFNEAAEELEEFVDDARMPMHWRKGADLEGGIEGWWEVSSFDYFFIRL